MRQLIPFLFLLFLFSCSEEDDKVYSIVAEDVFGFALSYPYVFEGQYIGTVNPVSTLKNINFKIQSQTIEGALRIGKITGNIEIANPMLIKGKANEKITAVIKIYKGKSVGFSMVTVYLDDPPRYGGTADLQKYRVWDLAYRNSNLEDGYKFNVKTEEYTFKISNNEEYSTTVYNTGDWKETEFVIELLDKDGTVIKKIKCQDYNATSISFFSLPVNLKANEIYTIRRTSLYPLMSRTIHTIDNSKIKFPFTVENITYLSSNFYNEDKFINKDKGIPQIFIGFE